MSAETSRNKLIRFIQEHSEESLRILVLFKFFKNGVSSKLEADGAKLDEDLLNQLCLEKAKRFATLGSEPSEQDIRDLIANMQSPRR